MSASAAHEKGSADVGKPEMRVEIEPKVTFFPLDRPRFNVGSK